MCGTCDAMSSTPCYEDEHVVLRTRDPCSAVHQHGGCYPPLVYTTASQKYNHVTRRLAAWLGHRFVSKRALSLFSARPKHCHAYWRRLFFSFPARQRARRTCSTPKLGSSLPEATGPSCLLLPAAGTSLPCMPCSPAHRASSSCSTCARSSSRTAPCTVWVKARLTLSHTPGKRTCRQKHDEQRKIIHEQA